MKNINPAKIFGLVVTLAFGTVLFFAFKFNGTPSEARNRRLDQERSMRLYNLYYSITDFYNAQSKLPKTLDEINLYNQSPVTKTDPDSGRQFDYKIIGKNKYQLCANFKTNQIQGLSRPYPAQPVSPPYQSTTTSPDFNNHQSGRICFDISTLKNTPQPNELKTK